MSYSGNSGIREQLRLRLETISSVGVVNDYPRNNIKHEDIESNFFANGKLNAWNLRWNNARGTKETGNSLFVSRRHSVIITGYYGIEDAVASAKTFEDIIEDVMNEFDKSHDVDTATGSTQARFYEACSLNINDEFMFSNWLVHRCEIELFIQETGRAT